VQPSRGLNFVDPQLNQIGRPFAPTYWLNLARGTIGPTAAPIMHIHGMLFLSWTLYFAWQTNLVAKGNIARHRASGLAGIALAATMVCAAILAIVDSMHQAALIGQTKAGEAFAAVPFMEAIQFAAFVGLAIANVTKPENHKRWMLLATISLLPPAFARWFVYFLAPPAIPPIPPASVIVTLPPSFVADLLVIAAMTYDWRTRGKPHPIYVWGLGALLFGQLIPVPLGASNPWMSFAHALSGLIA